MKVYAGIDPLTGCRHYLDEVVPVGRRAAAEAERARTRLLSQVDERRNPKTIRSLHWVLNSAMKCAVRWRWLATNPRHPTKRVLPGGTDHDVGYKSANAEAAM